MECIGESRAQTLIHIQHTLHIGRITRQNHNHIHPIVRERGQQCIYYICTKITLSIFGAQLISLINEEYIALGSIQHRLHFLLCLANVFPHKVTLLYANDISLREKPHRCIDLTHKIGYGSFSCTWITGEDHMQRWHICMHTQLHTHISHLYKIKMLRNIALQVCESDHSVKTCHTSRLRFDLAYARDILHLDSLQLALCGILQSTNTMCHICRHSMLHKVNDIAAITKMFIASAIVTHYNRLKMPTHLVAHQILILLAIQVSHLHQFLYRIIIKEESLIHARFQTRITIHHLFNLCRVTSQNEHPITS